MCKRLSAQESRFISESAEIIWELLIGPTDANISEKLLVLCTAFFSFVDKKQLH